MSRPTDSWRQQIQIGAILGIAALLSLSVAVPCGAFMCSPLRKAESVSWRAIAPVAALAGDGAPKKFPIPYARHNAWMRLPDGIWGHVFLWRVPGTNEIRALGAQTEPWGFDVSYRESEGLFYAMCWALRFDLDGLPKQRTTMAVVMPSFEASVREGIISIRMPD